MPLLLPHLLPLLLPLLLPPLFCSVSALDHPGPLPTSMELPLVVAYDSSLLAAHSGHGAARAWVGRVVAGANSLLATLQPAVRLAVQRVEHWPAALTARDLDAHARQRPNRRERALVLVGPTRRRGKAVAYMGSACRTDGYALALASDRGQDRETSRDMPALKLFKLTIF